jgi:hypothetical protein
MNLNDEESMIEFDVLDRVRATPFHLPPNGRGTQGLHEEE